MTGDRISLELPARPEYGRVARVAAANLALRRGYTLAEIDDLRLAMDEAVITLLGPREHDATMSVTYDAETARLTIDLQVVDGEVIPPERASRFAEIAGSLLDHYDIDRLQPSVRIVKRRAQRSDDE